MGMRGHKANPYLVRYRARRKLDHEVPRDLIAKAPSEPIVATSKPAGAATPPSSSAATVATPKPATATSTAPAPPGKA